MKKVFKKIKVFLKKYKIIILIISLLTLLVLSFFSFNKNEEQELPKDVQKTGEFFYENYKIRMSEALIKEVDEYSGEYEIFEIQMVDHFQWAENFVKSLDKELEYTASPHPAMPDHDFHTLDQTLHSWRNEKNYVSYDVAKDILTFDFEEPEIIPNIQINPNSRESVEKGLFEISKKFFSEQFEYTVNEISKHNEFYIVSFSRILNGIPIYLHFDENYLVVSQQGGIRSGKFLLAEFENFGNQKVISGKELKENINKANYKKTVGFKLLDEGDYTEYIHVPTGFEEGEIDLESVKLVYFYKNRFQKTLELSYVFDGSGKVYLDGYETPANFYVHIK